MSTQHQHPYFCDDLDDHSARIDGRDLSFEEAEDQERAARANEPHPIDLDLLACFEKDASKMAEATFALIGILQAYCDDEAIRDAVQELVEAKEDDFGTGGPSMAYRRALERNRKLTQNAERLLKASPHAPSAEAVALGAAARLGADDLRETLRFAYLGAVRLDRWARESCDDLLDLSDDPNEVMRSLLDDDAPAVLADQL